MVAPLFVIALLWDRFDWGASRLFHLPSFSLHLAGFRRTVSAANLATGLLLSAIGVATIWVGFTGPSMSLSGWQADLVVRLQHYGHLVTTALSWVPGWMGALVFFAALAGLGRLAWRQVHPPATGIEDGGAPTDVPRPEGGPTDQQSDPMERVIEQRA